MQCSGAIVIEIIKGERLFLKVDVFPKLVTKTDLLNIIDNSDC